jgi:hypothetical protein
MWGRGRPDRSFANDRPRPSAAGYVWLEILCSRCGIFDLFGNTERALHSLNNSRQRRLRLLAICRTARPLWPS